MFLSRKTRWTLFLRSGVYHNHFLVLSGLNPNSGFLNFESVISFNENPLTRNEIKLFQMIYNLFYTKASARVKIELKHRWRIFFPNMYWRMASSQSNSSSKSLVSRFVYIYTRRSCNHLHSYFRYQSCEPIIENARVTGRIFSVAFH